MKKKKMSRERGGFIAHDMGVYNFNSPPTHKEKKKMCFRGRVEAHNAIGFVKPSLNITRYGCKKVRRWHL